MTKNPTRRRFKSDDAAQQYANELIALGYATATIKWLRKGVVQVEGEGAPHDVTAPIA